MKEEKKVKYKKAVIAPDSAEVEALKHVDAKIKAETDLQEIAAEMLRQKEAIDSHFQLQKEDAAKRLDAANEALKVYADSVKNDWGKSKFKKLGECKLSYRLIKKLDLLPEWDWKKVENKAKTVVPHLAIPEIKINLNKLEIAKLDEKTLAKLGLRITESDEFTAKLM